MTDFRTILFDRTIIDFSEDSDAFAYKTINNTEFVSTSLGNTSSFRYDLDQYGLKSTQQLNIDWSDFANHTFFNSAQVKTNVAFQKIFNLFPFDGTQEEVELFLDKLSGFEKYVYDQWPKHIGYLFFSGTKPAETTGGTYVVTKDQAGVTAPSISRNTTAINILNPIDKSLTIEMHIFIPAEQNYNSWILHKFNNSNNHGFGIALNANATNTSCNLSFFVASGSSNVLTCNINNMPKGIWNHIAFVWDRSPDMQKVLSYLNHNLNSSSSYLYISNLDINSTDLIIGSGSNMPFFSAVTTLSGAIDELRIWHKIVDTETRKKNAQKAIFAQNDLKLYYKFNEPSGSASRYVLDSSSNSLHGLLSISGYNLGVREIPTGSNGIGPNPMIYEKLSLSPILFTNHPNIKSFYDTLIASASYYDELNPNLITKLIPKHYLFTNSRSERIINNLVYGSENIQNVQMDESYALLLLMYTWASFFDELKLYIQAFSDIFYVDYDNIDTAPDKFLQFIASRYGIKLPPLFDGSTIEQFINAENINNEASTNTYSLQYIRNQIWKRILINLNDIISSKGTIHSIKAFIRSVGIDPDSNFRIREFGGPTKRSLNNSREYRSKVAKYANFISGGIIQSPYLYSTRTEPGKPNPSSTTNDGLLTSGSWTFEAIYKFPLNTNINYLTQSLARMFVTGNYSEPGSLTGNLVAFKDGGVKLFIRSGLASSEDVILTLPINIFDGEEWNISFGVLRNDYFNSYVSSSVFLRAGKQVAGNIITVATSSGLTNPYANYNPALGQINYWSELHTTKNTSGSFFRIGNENSSTNLQTNAIFLTTDPAAFSKYFTGFVSNIHFWSKYLSYEEWLEHVRNRFSLGVQDPTTNFNFVTNKSGSFERLRFDVSMDQETTGSNNTGNITLFDFSQNNFHWQGKNFTPNSTVIYPFRAYYSILSPKFDVGATDEKIRIRSFLDYNNVVSSSYASVAPVHEITPSEQPQDNTRFTIDFSIVDALDQDIINIFSTFDIFDNAIGEPALLFSNDYPTLDNLREIYFKRLEKNINLKSFFELFKWFDTNIGIFIKKLIPRKTKYLGTNYVIESHMLERHKMEYFFSDIYLGDDKRYTNVGGILLQQFVGLVKRY